MYSFDMWTTKYNNCILSQNSCHTLMVVIATLNAIDIATTCMLNETVSAMQN